MLYWLGAGLSALLLVQLIIAPFKSSELPLVLWSDFFSGSCVSLFNDSRSIVYDM